MLCVKIEISPLPGHLWASQGLQRLTVDYPALANMPTAQQERFPLQVVSLSPGSVFHPHPPSPWIIHTIQSHSLVENREYLTLLLLQTFFPLLLLVRSAPECNPHGVFVWCGVRCPSVRWDHMWLINFSVIRPVSGVMHLAILYYVGWRIPPSPMG